MTWTELLAEFERRKEIIDKDVFMQARPQAYIDLYLWAIHEILKKKSEQEK